MVENSCIHISKLVKQYQGSDGFALNEISFDIFDGEIFGLLGPNGAGKTTFLSILCGLLKPSSGDVSIYNYSLNKDIESIKKIFGVVPQDFALYPTLSGRDNLMYIGRMYGLRGNLLNDRVQTCLSKFGFDKNSDEPVKNYSGGMKRRINLIGGILHEPKVLLLDEPTVGMDVQTRTAIIEHLQELNQTKKTTIIYTSHNLDQAELFCNRVGIIDKGQLLCIDSPQELMKKENCADLEEVFLKLTGRKIRD
ncbi:MAG: ABC transporter ATP-binding protein [Bacteroidia bacterium]